jgi:uroporphyrinogen-III synthase
MQPRNRRVNRAAAPPTVVSATRPLAGVRVAFTGTASHAADFDARVRALGGEPLIAPAIAIGPPASWSALDHALRHVSAYDWLAVTSANAVRAVMDRADAIGVPRDALRERRLAAVGPATSDALASALRPPDVVPRVHTAAALAAEMPDVHGGRVLFPRGDLAGHGLADGLRHRGASVDDVIVYRTVPGPGIETIVAGLRDDAIGVLLFASPSAVRFVAGALTRTRGESPHLHPARWPSWPVVVCIGPVTADAAREQGFHPEAVVESATLAELIDAAAAAVVRRHEDRETT